MSKNAKLFDLGTQYERYKKSEKMNLTESNMNKITSSLALEEIANNALSYRLKTGDLYYNYEKNPLSLQNRK